MFYAKQEIDNNVKLVVYILYIIFMYALYYVYLGVTCIGSISSNLVIMVHVFI